MAGSCLADFQPLLPAEQEVIATLRSGDFDRLGHEEAGSLPETEDTTRTVRAEFLRFLLLGGEDVVWVFVWWRGLRRSCQGQRGQLGCA